MGLTHIEGTVAGPAGKEATLKFLVDSGATYTVLPYKNLARHPVERDGHRDLHPGRRD